MELKTLPLSKIKSNPDNPRVIKDDKFKKLVQSLKDFPEMSQAREIVVNKDYVILGGNMRFKAMQEAGWSETTVKVVDWSEEKQKEFVIKDNANFGEWDWDILANEWSEISIGEWGVDTPSDWSEEELSPVSNDVENPMHAIVVVAFDDIQDLDRITELYNLESIKMNRITRELLSNQSKCP